MGCGTTELHVIRSLDGISPDYIYRFLAQPSVRQEAKENFTGSAGQARVPSAFIEELKIPLAPASEQRRIVSKLEMLLSKVDGCKDRLAGLPTILRRFRQAVLAAACSGRLTADWRHDHADIEPGSKLLERIRRCRQSSAKTTKETRQIQEAFEPDRLHPSHDELLFDEVPPTWISCRVGAVGTVLNGSTPSRKDDRFWNGDIPWVSSGEVRNNLITETRERITKKGFDNSSVRMLQPGTVLIAMIGEGKTRGQSAVLKIQATINQNIGAVLLTHGLVLPEFLWRWFQTHYEANRERGSGSGPQALNCERVREIPFILPPLAEQKEILRRIESQLVFADKIEARLSSARSQVDQLSPSLLAKAFKGELVCNESELAEAEGRAFESAQELLEGIAQNDGRISVKILNSNNSRKAGKAAPAKRR